MSAISVGTVTPSSIVLNWAPLTSASLNGRDGIIFYKVEYLSSGGSWVVLN